MAGSTTNISIRMDSDLKAQAERLFGELGMNLTTAYWDVSDKNRAHSKKSCISGSDIQP